MHYIFLLKLTNVSDVSQLLQDYTAQHPRTLSSLLQLQVSVKVNIELLVFALPAIYNFLQPILLFHQHPEYCKYGVALHLQHNTETCRCLEHEQTVSKLQSTIQKLRHSRCNGMSCSNVKSQLIRTTGSLQHAVNTKSRVLFLHLACLHFC